MAKLSFLNTFCNFLWKVIVVEVGLKFETFLGSEWHNVLCGCSTCGAQVLQVSFASSLINVILHEMVPKEIGLVVS